MHGRVVLHVGQATGGTGSRETVLHGDDREHDSVSDPELSTQVGDVVLDPVRRQVDTSADLIVGQPSLTRCRIASSMSESEASSSG